MNIPTQNAIDLATNCIIKSIEGLSLSPYICPAGRATIGYGSTFYSDGSRVTLADKNIAEEKANDLLYLHINNTVIPTLWPINFQLTDFENAALISFIYNIGSYAFLNSTFLRLLCSLIRGNELEKAFKAYNKGTINGVKQEIKGLTYRRDWEWQIFSANILLNDATINFLEK